jgi:hypothetical protein
MRELMPGDIVGSALLLSNAPANVDPVALEPVRSMCWGVDTLERYRAANPDVRSQSCGTCPATWQENRPCTRIEVHSGSLPVE